MPRKHSHKKPNFLRRYRKARNLNQRQVAAILGLKSTGIISRWEQGACFPATPSLLKLAVLYRTMADSLYLDFIRELREEIHRREALLLDREQTHNDEITSPS